MSLVAQACGLITAGGQIVIGFQLIGLALLCISLAMCCYMNHGVTIAGLTTDYAGNAVPLETVPEIGVYEIEY